jgi:hypothetical protein
MEGHFSRQFIIIDFDTLEDEGFQELVGGVFASYCLLRRRIWRSLKPDRYGLHEYFAQGDLCATLSQEELAAKLHTTPRNARRFIKALKDRGLVRALNTGRGNIYKLGEIVVVRTKEGETGRQELYYLDLWAQRRPLPEPDENVSAESGPELSAQLGQGLSRKSGQELSGASGPNLSDKEIDKGREKEIDKRVGEKAVGEVAYLTDQIVQLCGDALSRPFYTKVAYALPSDVIYGFLSEIRQDAQVRSRGAVFTTKVKAYLRAHPGQVGLRRMIGS